MKIIILSLISITSLIINFLLIKEGNFGITPLIFWIISIICTIYIFLPLKTYPKINLKNHNLFIIILIILLYSLRGLLFVDPSNVYFHGDEAIISRNAQTSFLESIESGKYNIFGSEDGTLNKLPALWYFVQGFIISTVGPSLFSIKFFSLITDFFICILGYLMVKKFINFKFGLIFIIIYVTFPISIHFSLTGYQNIQSTFFLLLSIYLLFNFIKEKTYKLYFMLLAGVASALSFYFYLSAIVIPIILVLSILTVFLILHIPFKLFIKTLATYLIGLIVGLIPYFAYSYFYYSFLFGRKEAILFFYSTDSVFKLLISQTKTYLLGFLPNGAMDGSGFFYGNLPGFNTWVLLIMFIFGIILIIFKKNILGIISIITIILTSITGGILTLDTPAPQRLIHIFPFIVILICFGINFFIVFINKINNFLNEKILLTFIVFIILFTNINSFISSNLSFYKKIFHPDLFEISLIYRNISEELFTTVPVHKKDQIYFYSGGKVNPISIGRNDFDNIDKGYLFIDNDNLAYINTPKTKKYKLIKEWFNDYDHTMLIKF